MSVKSNGLISTLTLLFSVSFQWGPKPLTLIHLWIKRSHKNCLERVVLWYVGPTIFSTYLPVYGGPPTSPSSDHSPVRLVLKWYQWKSYLVSIVPALHKKTNLEGTLMSQGVEKLWAWDGSLILQRLRECDYGLCRGWSVWQSHICLEVMGGASPLKIEDALDLAVHWEGE